MSTQRPTGASQTSPKGDSTVVEVKVPHIPLPPEDIDADEMILNMGPQHPSTHGVLRLEVTTDGEIIRKVRPFIGYLHRCFEKHSEKVGYPGVVPYTDRIDYIAAMNNNHAYVVAVEKLLEMEIPERAECIRVIIAELNRISSHLIAFGTYALDLGAVTPFTYAFREREVILDIFEMTCGARLTYNYYRVGGLNQDLTDEIVDKILKFLEYFEPKLKEYDDLLSFNKIFIERTAGVGILPPDVAISYGASGPMLRGSGVKFDIRRDDPYSIYDRFDFEIPVGEGREGVLGDCWDRYIVRMREMAESCKIIRQALELLTKAEGGFMVEKPPKMIRPPKGAEAYTRVETPRGELGFYIISDGTANPYRCKARSPCFTNLSIVPAISQGVMLADLVAIVGSVDIVLGCVDR